jgi:isopenicillin-N N-acyltransferase-like protein
MTTERHLVLDGAPYSRGVEHGERLSDEIRTNLDVYRAQYEYRGVDLDDARADANRFVSIIERDAPDYLEEMRGIADGADLDLVDVTLLNVRYEVMYSAYSEEAAELATGADGDLTDGCTSFGVQPRRTADGRTYLGENWDWKPDVETVVIEQRHDDGPAVLAVTEAGIVGYKMGLNEAGIGLVINGLVTPNDGENPFRKPFHVRSKEILDAARFEDAIRPIVETDRACSANFLLGHADGELIDFEAAPEVVNYLYPEDGLLTHANHFEDRRRVESTNERRSPSTLYRARRLRRLIESAGDVTVDDLESALADHFGRPASICRHADTSAEPLARSRTNLGLVLDLERGSLSVTDGPPCEREFERYSLHGT